MQIYTFKCIYQFVNTIWILTFRTNRYNSSYFHFKYISDKSIIQIYILVYDRVHSI